MKKESFSTFDAADYLETEADIAAYLEAANEDGDPKVCEGARPGRHLSRARIDQSCCAFVPVTNLEAVACGSHST